MEKVSKTLECPLCGNLPSNLVSLPCLHSFCLTCLQKHLDGFFLFLLPPSPSFLPLFLFLLSLSFPLTFPCLLSLFLLSLFLSLFLFPFISLSFLFAPFSLFPIPSPFFSNLLSLLLLFTEKEKESKHKCPKCRTPFPLPSEEDLNLKDLPSLFFTEALSSLTLQKEGENQNPANKLCELCENNSATLLCQMCQEHHCEECKMIHQRSKMSRNHTYVPLEEIDFKKSLPPRPLLCPFHPNQEIDTFCKKEKVPICSKCAVENHGNHEVAMLSEAFAQIKEDIQNKLQHVFFLCLFPFSFRSFNQKNKKNKGLRARKENDGLPQPNLYLPRPA